MPQSLAALYVHVVFSTKERKPMIEAGNLRADLHAYLGGICKGLDCAPLMIGGVEDHVHILARQSRVISVADFVRDIKSNSSSWMKKQGSLVDSFAWQGGYGAFSVGIDGVDRVRKYIENQESHHRGVSFQDEFRALLREAGIEWDEKYVWD